VRRDVNSETGYAIRLGQTYEEFSLTTGDIDHRSARGKLEQLNQAVELLWAGRVADEVTSMGDVEELPDVHGLGPRLPNGLELSGAAQLHRT
jgi:hypothetical protein